MKQVPLAICSDRRFLVTVLTDSVMRRARRQPRDGARTHDVSLFDKGYAWCLVLGAFRCLDDDTMVTAANSF